MKKLKEYGLKQVRAIFQGANKWLTNQMMSGERQGEIRSEMYPQDSKYQRIVDIKESCFTMNSFF